MKIDDIINKLQALKDSGETNVLISWWDRRFMAKEMNISLDKEEFNNFVEDIESSIDWSDINEQINKEVLVK